MARPISRRSTTRANARVVLVASLLVMVGPPAAQADQPAYAWSLVTRSAVPATLHPGEKLPVVIVLRNDGTETWRSDETAEGTAPLRLGTTSPRDRASAFASADATWRWGSNRIRMLTPTVAPGETGTFAFTFTAPTLPAYPATFDERFAPVAEGTAWMDATQISIVTQVRPVSAAVPAVPNPATPEPPCTPLAPKTEGPRAPGPGDAVPVGASAGYNFGTDLAPGLLDGPTDVAVDTVGKLIVVDGGRDRVRRLDLDGFELFSWGGTGSTPGRFIAPGGVAVSALGQIYIADTGNDRIQRFSLGGVYIGQFGITGGAPGQFREPRGLAFLPDGRLAVADTGNDRIQVLSPTGAPLSVIGSTGIDPGRLRAPRAISSLGEHLYVADTGNDRVQRLRVSDGAVAGVWGGAGTATGCMAAPGGIVANAAGVFVADSGHHRIQHFTRTGVHLEAWGSNGTATGRFASPGGLALGAGAEVYVADTGNDRIQRFNPRAAARP
jgi:DNA-binding beta-propeller fold protein YncE